MKRNPKALYAMTCALGGQWTVVYMPEGSYSAHSLTGYGEFPVDRFPGIPHVDMRTSERIDTSFYVAEQFGTHFGSNYIPLAEAINRWKDCGATVS